MLSPEEKLVLDRMLINPYTNCTLDLMEELGIVSPLNGSRPRDVIMSREEWQLKLAKIKKQQKKILSKSEK